MKIEAIKKNLNFLKKIKHSSSKTKLILFYNFIIKIFYNIYIYISSNQEIRMELNEYLII